MSKRLLEVIDENRRLTKEVELLRALRDAAQAAADYHRDGYGGIGWDANHMVMLLDKLGEQLERTRRGPAGNDD